MTVTKNRTLVVNGRRTGKTYLIRRVHEQSSLWAACSPLEGRYEVFESVPLARAWALAH